MSTEPFVREILDNLDVTEDTAMEPRPRSLFQVYRGKLIAILILAVIIWALASVMIYWPVPDLTFWHALLDK